MDEVEQGKDHLMTMRKLALSNLGRWGRRPVLSPRACPRDVAPTGVLLSITRTGDSEKAGGLGGGPSGECRQLNRDLRSSVNGSKRPDRACLTVDDSASLWQEWG